MNIYKNMKISSMQHGKIHNIWHLNTARHVKNQENITHNEKKKWTNGNRPRTFTELADKDILQNVSRQNINQKKLKMDHRAKPIQPLKRKGGVNLHDLS